MDDEGTDDGDEGLLLLCIDMGNDVALLFIVVISSTSLTVTPSTVLLFCCCRFKSSN